jgi:hypothetical protein
MSDPLAARFATANDDDDDTDSSMLGQKLKRRLMDIDSSFVADGAAALQTINNGTSNQSASKLMGLDDTFLFGGSPGRIGHLAKTSPADESEATRDSSAMLPSSPAAAAMQRGMIKGIGGRSSGAVNLKFSESNEDDEKYVIDARRET